MSIKNTHPNIERATQTLIKYSLYLNIVVLLLYYFTSLKNSLLYGVIGTIFLLSIRYGILSKNKDIQAKWESF